MTFLTNQTGPYAALFTSGPGPAGWSLSQWWQASYYWGLKFRQCHVLIPWTARRSNQLIPKEINPEYSLEGLMLKLRRQYFGHLIQRANSLEKILMLGKIEGKRRRRQQRMRWVDGIIDSMGMSLSRLWKTGRGMEAWRASVHESDMTERLNNNSNILINANDLDLQGEITQGTFVPLHSTAGDT